MSVTVRIPTPLRKLTKQADVVSGDGGTLASCIESLERQYPGLKTQEAVAPRLQPALAVQPTIASFEEALSERTGALPATRK